MIEVPPSGAVAVARPSRRPIASRNGGPAAPRRYPWRVLRFLLVFAVTSSWVACQPQDAPFAVPVDEAYGSIVGAPFYVVPSSHWQTTDDGRWRFHAQGELVVHVARSSSRTLDSEAAAGLVVELQASPDSQSYQPRILWRGRPWSGEPQVFGELLRLEIPASDLPPGTHRLTLRRDYPGDAMRVAGARPETHFEAVRYRLGDVSGELRSESLERYRQLREFFDLGLAGSGDELLGGLLVDGAQTVDLVASESGELRFQVESVGGRDRGLSLTAPRLDVHDRIGSASQSRWTVPLAAGESARLEIQGGSGLTIVGDLHFAPAGDADTSPRPSIVLITLDTTRRDFVAPYHPESATPSLAAFAGTATVFDRALATSPWTLPSHSSILTGLWPSQHGAGSTHRALPSSLETLTEHLRAAGYRTLGTAGGFLARHQFGLAQGMHRYRNPAGFETTGEELTDHVLGLLQEATSRPLFLFANYFDPHALFQAPSSFQERFEVAPAGVDLEGLPVWGELVAGNTDLLSAAIRGEGGFGPAVEEYLRRAYRAELAYMDDQLGRLFEGLRAGGLWDETLIVVVADHGELLGERGLFTHAHRLDPELVEIPLLIKWPGQRAGRRIETPVSQVDLFPTILRAAGLRIPREQQGALLYPDREPTVPPERFLYFEEHEAEPHPLFAEMKVAKDLLGAQQGDLRVTAWDDHLQCERQHGGVWMPAECPPEAPDFSALSTAVGFRASTGSEGVERSEAEEAALRALGYL